MKHHWFYFVGLFPVLFFQNAESVEVDSIPLPDMPHAPSNIHIQDIPLPGAQPPSILKKTSAFGYVEAAANILDLLIAWFFFFTSLKNNLFF